MPLCRVRQAVACISERRKDDLKVNAGLVQWHAQHVASVTAVSEEAGKQIRTWRVMDDDERDALPEMTDDELYEKVFFGGDEEIDVESAAAADPRNDAGMMWLESVLQPQRGPGDD